MTTPWSGQSWNIGDAQDIIWTSTGVTQPNVKIMLWRGETNVLDIMANTPNNGRYRWRIPGTVAPGTYKIRVKTVGASTLGISAAFDISNAKITVTQPNTNVTWKPGETHLIQWTHTSPMDQRVWIKLFPNHEGLSIYSIINFTENDGSYSWTVPGSVPPGEYQLILRTIDSQVVCEGPNVNIGSGSARIPHISERVSALLKRPALSISDVRLKADDDGFVITFCYKNSGTGPLPKSSEMPVKPDYRVLIDNREIARGGLIFPAFQAPPGWEVPTFYGGEIKYQTSGLFDYSWTIGNLITVKINENEVNGMAGDSESYNLKPMALNESYDVMITGATLDWNTGILRTDIRIDGSFGSYDKFIYSMPIRMSWPALPSREVRPSSFPDGVSTRFPGSGTD